MLLDTLDDGKKISEQTLVLDRTLLDVMSSNDEAIASVDIGITSVKSITYALRHLTVVVVVRHVAYLPPDKSRIRFG